MEYKKWLIDQAKEKKRVMGENDYKTGQRPVDPVALKKRKLEREALKSSGIQDRQGRYFECELCDAIFLQPMSLQKHARQKHKEVREQEMGLKNTASTDSSLKCSHCGIYFASQIKLDYHLSSLMESVPNNKLKHERTKPDIDLKLEPVIKIKVEPDEVITRTNKVKSEPCEYNIKIEEHSCNDCDFRTLVRLEYMDHLLYDCNSGGDLGHPQEMGDGWSFRTGIFYCLKCQFNTKEKVIMFKHARTSHTTAKDDSKL